MPEPLPNTGRDARYDPDKVSDASFDVVRRGFNEGQVRQFLLDLGAALRSAYRTEDALRVSIADLDAKLVEASEVDEHVLTERLGAEAAAILNTAREAAAKRVADAEEAAVELDTDSQRQAEATLAAAEKEAEQALATAEQAAEEALAAATSILEVKTAEADVEAAKRLAESEDELVARRAKAEEIIADAKQQGRVLLVEAQRHREQMLGNLEKRRMRLREQIERLQAGRDRLLEAYDVVQKSIDMARHDLETAIPEARIAGDRAVRRLDDDVPRSIEFLEDEVEEARRGGLLGDLDEIAAEAAAMGGVDTSAPAVDDVPEPASPLPPPPPESAAEPEPVVDVGHVEPEPVADIDHVEPEPVADEDHVEPEPVADVDHVEPEPVADEGHVEPEPVADEDHVEPEPVTDEAEAAADPPPESVDAESTEDAGGAASLFARLREEHEAEEPTTDETVTDESVPEVEAEPGRGLLDARAETTESLGPVVARNLKRALSELQNDVLNCHRTDGDRNQAINTSALAASVAEPLADAWAAGAQAVGRPGSAAEARLDNVLLAIEPKMLAPLRESLDNALDESAAVEAVRVVCRDTRAGLSDLAVDAVEAAFADGMADTLPADCPVHWVAGDRTDDTRHGAENGGTEVRLGEPFPNGDVRPAPFSDCGCLVAPLHS